MLESRVLLSVTSVFELDGNATTTTTHDWDQVFAGTSGAIANGFLTDKVNSSTDDIFQGGGSKDTLGFQSGPWLFTDSKPQAKDDITHAFASAYTDPSNGHLILYAGLDRFDNSGDATAGFWFLQGTLAENSSVNTGGGHPFVGTHTDGDILLVSDFTIGGSTSTIKVFRWTGDDATGSLVALNNGNGVANSTFVIVNGGPVTVPWTFKDKSGNTKPAAGEFLEEGIDLTALGLEGCFATFLAETRSSQSPSATLSDFAMGSFPLCSIAGTPRNLLSKVGDSTVYPLTVTNTGGIPLYIQSVSDTLLGNIVVNGALKQPGQGGVNQFVTSISSSFNFSQPLAPGASLTINVTRTVQASDPDPTVSTTTFVGNHASDFTGDQTTTTSTNTVNLFQPRATLTVTPSSSTALHIGDVITYTYTVNNTSSSDSPNLVLSLSNASNSFTDTLLGNLESFAIGAGGGSVAPGGSFTFTRTRAIQSGDPDPLVNTATVVFTLAQNLGSFDNLITAQASATIDLLPELSITKVAADDDLLPGDTATYTITVSNTGAGQASNVVMTDQLPEADLLSWSVGSSTFDTTTKSAGDLLTANKTSLAGGSSASVTVNATIPLDIFGQEGGAGNGHPLPTGLFELDGDAENNAGVTGDDWANVLFGSGGLSVASSLATDQVNSRGDDIFTGGGSKDTLGIQQGPWLFTNSKPQAKDDITHAFASMYTDSATGDVILYAGLTRYDNSGAATAGFWFLQDEISENSSVKVSGGHPFAGTHRDGDILLVSDFTIGGSVSTIKVFRWTGDDASGSLVEVAAPPNSTFAIVNGGPVSVPFAFKDKSKNTNPAAGEFLEEGVNLSALGLGGCFSNFLAETRSSQSPSATLSDYVIGNFNTCRLELHNTATVQAAGISPKSTGDVVIVIGDGHVEAAALTVNALTASALTVQSATLTTATNTAAGSRPSTAIGLDRAIEVANDKAVDVLQGLPTTNTGTTSRPSTKTALERALEVVDDKAVDVLEDLLNR